MKKRLINYITILIVFLLLGVSNVSANSNIIDISKKGSLNISLSFCNTFCWLVRINDLYLFMEYAVSTGRCKKIIILTNGILLDNHLPRFVDFNKYHKVPIQIKMSINYWLLNMNNNLIEDAINYHLSTKYIDGVDMFYNVRMRHSDEYLKDLINNSVLKDVSNIFYLQRYGKYEDEEEYDLPFIVQNIDDWFLYSTDGTCFNKDIIARSYYEKELD